MTSALSLLHLWPPAVCAVLFSFSEGGHVEFFACLRHPPALFDVAPHSFEPPDVLVFVQLSEGLVLFDVEDQICEGPKSVPELHEVAFEVAADDMLGPDQCHLPGERTQFKPALLVEGERELLVVGEVPLVEQMPPIRRGCRAGRGPPPASSG